MTEQGESMIRTVRTLGWSLIIVSIVVIISECVSLFFYNPISQIDFLIRIFPHSHVEALETLTDMFQYSRAWSIYTILYFIAVFIGAIQFVQFRAAGRTLLEIACTIGIINACVDTYLSYSIWKNMQNMMSTFLVNISIPLENLNPFGIVTIIAGFFLWIVPSIGLIIYLRRPALKALMK